MITRLINTKNILIIIIVVMAIEVALRIIGHAPFVTEYPHFWETNFEYDQCLGWVSKPNFTVELEAHGFCNIPFDMRGFPLISNVVNDKVNNENKIFFIGRCDTYGGPMIGPEKSFMNLLARDVSDQLDFDVIGVSGYSLYQEYLLNQKFNQGDYDLVIVSFCPFFDFYLDSVFYMHALSNRYVPRPYIKDGKLQHDPVPYVKSYWESELHNRERFNFFEKFLRNFYVLAWVVNFWENRESFDVELTKTVVSELKKNIEAKGGRLALFVLNWAPDTPDPYLTAVTDEFICWLKQNDVGVIDVRQKLIGYSLAKYGDPTHFNSDGQQIVKDEIQLYLKNIGLIPNR